jgi:hypothetical protein
VGGENAMMKYLLGTCLYLSACSSPSISDADLVGVYVANYRGDTGTLSLMADHTYTHIIQLKDGHIQEVRATWKISRVTGSTFVEVINFRALPSFGGVGTGWITEPERSWSGHIQLCFDSDVGYCYIKLQKS